MGGCVTQTLPVTFVSGAPVVTESTCIEVNPRVFDNRFLPALQIALIERGVKSEIYTPGTAPATCKSLIVYRLDISYVKTGSGGEPSIYWSTIDLNLIRYGEVVSSAHYESHGPQSNWVGNRRLASMVGRMIAKHAS